MKNRKNETKNLDW